MAKFCPYCGNQLGERSKFCPRCGKASPQRRRPTGALLDEPAPGANSPAPAAPGPAEQPQIAAAQAQGATAGSEARTRVRPVTGVNPAGQITSPIPGGRAHIYAPPTHALFGTYEQAGFGLRYGAWMFDFLITLIAMMTFTFAETAVSRRAVVGSNRDLLIVAGLTLLMFLANFLLLAGSNGQSVGMRILGIRIIRTDARPFKIRHAFVRHIIGYPLSTALFFLGFLWMLWDPRQQGWHDKLARTIVVMSR